MKFLLGLLFAYLTLTYSSPAKSADYNAEVEKPLYERCKADLEERPGEKFKSTFCYSTILAYYNGFTHGGLSAIQYAFQKDETLTNSESQEAYLREYEKHMPGCLPNYLEESENPETIVNHAKGFTEFYEEKEPQLKTLHGFELYLAYLIDSKCR